MPRPRSADHRFLERHGNKWRVVVSVPRDLQATMGKTKLKQALPTDSLAEANRLKWPVVGRLERMIAEQREPGNHHDRALRLARMRKDLEADGGDLEGIDHVILDHAERLAGAPVGNHEGQPVFDPQREAAAQAFAGVAFGKRTPIDAHREAWLATISDLKPRTLADDERALRYLLQWCKANSVAPFLESFGRREAARFVDDFGNEAHNLSPVTRNKYLRRLSQYWKWMVRRDAARGNVWEGQTYTVPRTLREDQERAFTDAEMVKLLTGPARPAMHDLMRIAALTGARIEPIVDLRVRDCSNGTFTFKAQKREPGARRCPIHPDLVDIIERRTRGRSPGTVCSLSGHQYASRSPDGSVLSKPPATSSGIVAPSGWTKGGPVSDEVSSTSIPSAAGSSPRPNRRGNRKAPFKRWWATSDPG